MSAHGPAVISVADLERIATDTLAEGALAYYAGGAGSELTLRENLAAWQRLRILPRVLVGAGERDPSIELLGRRRPHPLIVAPVAYQGLAHPDAELATARAAAATGTIMSLSTFANASIEAVAQAAPDAPRWFQLYVFRDRGFSRELVARAEAQGYEALVITADLPVVGVRERELRFPVEVAGAATPGDLSERIDPDLKWADVARIATDTALPVLVKGILSPADAALAAEHGARGVVVSNHGGRQLDTVVPAAEALAPVVQAAGEDLEVLVDGGIRRGTDVLKALALGARAVLVGRPVLWGLAAGGEQGVRQAIEILLGELDVALALSGAVRAQALNASFLVPAVG
ncbi:MAG: alpha-hydroxy-acid oxidizing protein [Solirubrobacterales bacterium]|nr:alpha-hydroxy-acid oxidizing protein [Solirubrobacterales bacterium]MBV9917928.1 alpha-hydroxy-acid oxidizing protein [Solirubrobacterales bacterium]